MPRNRLRAACSQNTTQSHCVRYQHRSKILQNVVSYKNMYILSPLATPQFELLFCFESYVISTLNSIKALSVAKKKEQDHKKQEEECRKKQKIFPTIFAI